MMSTRKMKWFRIKAIQKERGSRRSDLDQVDSVKRIKGGHQKRHELGKDKGNYFTPVLEWNGDRFLLLT